MKLGYVILFVKEVPPLRDWYKEHLGLTLIEESPDGSFAMFECDSATLLAFHEGEAILNPSEVGLHFEVPDVDAAFDRLVAEGVEFEKPPEDMPWGKRSAFTRDPAGHTVGIYSAIKA